MADKLDFKKRDKAFYSGKSGRWDQVTVPSMTYLMIDGQGDPNGPGYARALSALYPVAYGLKFAAKDRGADFVVPPLEAVWWSENPEDFVSGNRNGWRWTAMIRMPDDFTTEDFERVRESATAKLAKKGGVDVSALSELRLDHLQEGDCLQTLHIGSYTDEAPVLADLHDRLMPELHLTFSLPHHEIYLSDPRRVAAEKLKTIIRQPVKPVQEPSRTG